ncbi:hypothetical protein CPB83DRAFT_907514 [Crepidotus variabilis]|uniref:Uncharacterized protein n=1 Tax=Crepidotus variabilis TaxID=179855 RepID=A0A9P6EEN9_9AGAR|nr:hypothetical protein CPB83DRAFT_907514 [Crepidotus variabilis]
MAHSAIVAAAVSNGSGFARTKPAPLSMGFSSDGDTPERRQSTTSYYTTATGNESEDEDPPLSALDSSTALILVHDSEESNSPFDFSEDEEEGEGDDELVSPMFELRKSAVFPPLPPSLVFLYLLAPYLRLGALNLPYSKLPLKFGLPALFLSALASAFARQIWYMLARYLRKANMTDILLDTFARGRGKERRRAFLRAATRSCTGITAILICIIYLRFSMYNLLPIMVQDDHRLLLYVLSTVLVNTILAYLSYARALDYRRIIYATWLSVAAYVAWLGLVIYAHSQGILYQEAGWLGSTSVWPGLATVTFAFCSSSTLPLYSSLKSTSNPLSTGKISPARSFRFLSFSSVLLAVLLLLPSIIFSAFPNRPASASHPFQNPNATVTLRLSIPLLEPSLNATSVPILSTHHTLLPDLTLPRVQIHTVIRVLASASLLLSIPSIMATTPQIAIPSLRSVKFNVSRVITILIVLICSVIPPTDLHGSSGHDRHDKPFINSSRFFGVVLFIILFMAYSGTYFLATFLHVSQHFFKRPLAIVVPPRTPLLQTQNSSANLHDDSNTIAGPSSGHTLSPSHDELLLRKERALQRRQLKRRIVWDIGVWLLLGTSVAGVVGFVGYLARFW